MFRSWTKRLFARKPTAPVTRAKSRRASRLLLEQLEDRTLLASGVAGGWYSLKFPAANPGNYLPVAAQGTPAPVGFTYSDPIGGADYNTSVTSLAPAQLTLGQI